MQEVDGLLCRAVPAALLVAVVVLHGCTGDADVQPVRAQSPVSTPDSVDHSAFTALLQAYVDEEGWVDYAAIQARQDAALTPYLRRLAETDPANLDRDARLAFWLNAYNALAIKLIVDHYPVASIRDITPAPGPSIPKVNSPFQIEVGEVGGRMRTLDEIEHGIIREEFDEPRIHFALVCAAVSCPRLRREAYAGNRLDRQLDEQARTFLHNPAKNRVPADDETIRLSRIFSWFQGDFGDDAADVQRYLAPYFEGTVRQQLEDAAYRVRYLDYDWALNDQASREVAAGG